MLRRWGILTAMLTLMAGLTLATGSARHVGDFAGQREIGSGHRLRVGKDQPPRGRVSVNSSTTLIAPYGPSTA